MRGNDPWHQGILESLQSVRDGGKDSFLLLSVPFHLPIEEGRRRRILSPPRPYVRGWGPTHADRGGSAWGPIGSRATRVRRGGRTSEEAGGWVSFTYHLYFLGF